MSSLQRYIRMTLVMAIILTLSLASAAPSAAQDTTTPGVESIPGTPITQATGATLQAFDNLNIRTGPGLNFPVLVTLAPSQGFVLAGRNADGSWLQVRVPDGRLGWVSTAVITTTLNLATLPVVTDAPAVVTAPPATPAEPVAGTGGQALGTVVNANNLNVRTGPGLAYGFLSSLPLGSSVVLEGRNADGSWLQVRLADGRLGWVSSAYMTTNLAIASLPVSETPAAPVVAAPAVTPTETAPGVGGLSVGTVTGANILNVRSGPGLNFPILTTLPLNQAVVLEGRNADGSWLQIRLADDQLGWVSSAFMTTNLAIANLPVTEPAAAPVVATPPITPTEPMTGVGGLALGTVVDATILNVRTGPGLNFGLLTTLPLGSTAVLEGRNADGSWLQIRLADGRLGWVSSAFMTANLEIANLPVVETEAAPAVETPPVTEPAAGVGGLATGTVVNANLLNVRSGPGLNFPVLATLPLGESVVLEGRDTGGFWLQVRLADGRLGWVSSGFMTANLDIANLPVTG
ncbi:MAG: hypothetical protein DCC55_20120 [Chloroflexi bacterium]|nr:MAG: hypothetical protein DCC55_20120 [Chloroflexota bacterium]